MNLCNTIGKGLTTNLKSIAGFWFWPLDPFPHPVIGILYSGMLRMSDITRTIDAGLRKEFSIGTDPFEFEF